MKSPVLSTGPLRLRALGRRDRRFYARIYADLALMSRVGPPLDRRAGLRSADALLASMHGPAPRAHCWTILLGPARRRIGLVGWRVQAADIELGAMLLPAWQGQGWAVAALLRVCAELIENQGAPRLLMRYRPGHEAAASVCRRLRFKERPELTDEAGRRVWTLSAQAWRGATSSPDEVS